MFAGLWLNSLSSAPSYRRYAISSLSGPLRKQVSLLNLYVCLLFLVGCICSHCAETFVEPTFFFFLYLSDEYILPKIAERKLRRYAILQSRSTEVGVNRPLHKVSFSLSLQVICYRSLSPIIGLSVEATT